jgi:hypothetical protein
MFSSQQYPLYGSNQQSFANGMQQDVPMPMQGLSSYMQPSMGQSPSYEMNKPQYASGGSVGLSQMAHQLQGHGEGDDKILAHINPEEARFLQQHFGGDINPKTGLPQFGWFSRAFRGLRKNKIAKVLLNVLPAVAGFMVAGPAGAAAAGALGGALSNKNPLKGGLLGGAIGGAGGYGAQALGLGASGAAAQAASGRAGAFSALQGVGKGAAGAGGKGLLGSLGGGAGLGGLLGGGMLSNALLGTAVLGTLAGKQKIPKEPPMHDVIGQNAEMMAANANMPGIRAHNEKEISASPLNRVRRNFDEDIFAPSNLGQEQYHFQDVNPQSVYMAQGGYLDGHSDGQADKIPAMLSDGEFVMPADVTAGLGDGNNKAGAKKLYGLIDQVRRQQRSKPKGLPPKAKSLSHYMKQRGAR